MWFLTTILLSYLEAPHAKSQAAPVKLSMNEIIANLEAAERLYYDHDVHFRVEMRLDEAMIARFQKPRDKKPPDGAMVVTVTAASDRKGHFVSQGQMFRLDREGGNVSVNGDEDRSWELINAFDGETQRRLSQHGVANISNTRREDRERFWPHTLMLSHAQLYGPLSVLLGGDQAIKASAFADQPQMADLPCISSRRR